MKHFIMFSLANVMAALLAFAAPPKAAAQYGAYPRVSQYSPYQPGPTAQDLGGTWYMSGDEDRPCKILPSRTSPYRVLVINDVGDRAGGFIRGNRITVPKWNLGASIDSDAIRWDNRSVWTR